MGAEMVKSDAFKRVHDYFKISEQNGVAIRLLWLVFGRYPVQFLARLPAIMTWDLSRFYLNLSREMQRQYSYPWNRPWLTPNFLHTHHSQSSPHLIQFYISCEVQTVIINDLRINQSGTSKSEIPP